MEDQNNETTKEFDPSQMFDSFVNVGKELIMRPRAFFRQLPRKGSLKNPLAYLVICAFLTSLFLANVLNGDYNLFFILLFATILSSFTGSLVLHGVAAKIFGSKAFYDATFRIIVYSGITNLVSWIPVLGQIASFYGLYLIFIGLQEIHQLKPRQAGIVVMCIVCIVMLLLVFRFSVGPMSPETGN